MLYRNVINVIDPNLLRKFTAFMVSVSYDIQNLLKTIKKSFEILTG